jgi:hypothetical protein
MLNITFGAVGAGAASRYKSGSLRLRLLKIGNNFHSFLDVPDLEVPDPDLEVPDPDLEVPDPDLEVPDPDLKVPDPDLKVPDPDLDVLNTDLKETTLRCLVDDVIFTSLSTVCV